MEPAGVSGSVTISEQRSYIKIETLHSKNPTEIQGVLREACGGFTVDCSTVSRWANHFHGSCVSVDSDPRPGRSRTTDERSVKLVADALEEDHCAPSEELSRAMGVLATSVFHILTNDLKKRNISARWVSSLLDC